MVKFMIFAWQICVWAVMILSFGVGILYLGRSAQDHVSHTIVVTLTFNFDLKGKFLIFAELFSLSALMSFV